MPQADRRPRLLSGATLPPRLADLPAPPRQLYLHGELPRGPSVAIVGTRTASAEGSRFARALACELAAAGVTIVSGGALGIDTAAHQGALDARGTTVVVAPCGLDHPFPKENSELFRQVLASGGAFLSLLPDDQPATRSGFFQRNACLVALAHVVIVAQAPFRSGARNAAAWARKLGRPLFAVPHAPWQAEGRGCIADLKLGANALDGARDAQRALAALNLHPLPIHSPSPAGAASQLVLPLEQTGLDADDPIMVALRAGAQHLDEIVERSGLPVPVVQERLLTLALSGVLVPDPSGSLKLVSV